MKRISLTILIFALWGAELFAAGEIYMTLDFPGAVDTFAGGIDGNIIVGSYNGAATNQSHGFIYDGSSFTTLDFPGSISTILTDIDGDRIVGYYRVASDLAHGFTYINGMFATMDHPLASPLRNGTQALGVSGNKIVGVYMDDTATTHAYTFDGATFTTLNNPFGINDGATGIDGSKIVGSYSTTGSPHGYIYDGTTYTHLDGPLGAIATVPIDVFGDRVVGYFVDASNVARGFLFDGTSYSILDQPTTLGTQFVPNGVYGNTLVGQYFKAGRFHGFVTIPEPASIGLLLTALLWLDVRHSSRKQNPRGRKRGHSTFCLSGWPRGRSVDSKPSRLAMH